VLKIGLKVNKLNNLKDYEEIADPVVSAKALEIITKNNDLNLQGTFGAEGVNRLITQGRVIVSSPKAVVRSGESFFSQEQSVILQIKDLKGFSLRCKYSASAWENVKKSGDSSDSIKFSSDLQLRFDLWTSKSTIKYLLQRDRSPPIKQLATAISKRDLKKLTGLGPFKLFISLANQYQLDVAGSKNQKKKMLEDTKTVISSVLTFDDVPRYEESDTNFSTEDLVDEDDESNNNNNDRIPKEDVD